MAEPANLSPGGLIPARELSEEQSSLLGLPYQAYRPGPIPEMSLENSPMTQRSASNSPAPSFQLEPLSTWGLEPDLSSAHFLRSDGKPAGVSTSPRRNRRTLILASAFPAIAAIVELLMLVYFLDVYLTLPLTKSGSRQRISPVYSIWPYISCVGSITETAFKTFSFLYAFFLVGTFVADMWVNHDASRGYILRWIRLFASVLAGGILIALVFASINDTNHLHLYLTSIRQISAVVVKVLSYLVDHLQRKHYPVMRKDRVMLISKRWKYVVFAGAVPAAILGSVGIYACQSWVQNRTPGTACYILVAMSAIADWTYEFLNIAFVLSLAFDMYNSEHFAKLRAQPQRPGQEGASKYQELAQMQYVDA